MAIIRYTINDDRGANHCPEVNSPDDELSNQQPDKAFCRLENHNDFSNDSKRLRFKNSDYLNFNNQTIDSVVSSTEQQKTLRKFNDFRD